MANRLDAVNVHTVGTTATDIDIGYGTVMLANSGSTTLYFKPKDNDGKAAKTDNAFPLSTGVVLQVPLSAKTISVISSGAGGKLAVLRMEDWS